MFFSRLSSRNVQNITTLSQYQLNPGIVVTLEVNNFHFDYTIIHGISQIICQLTDINNELQYIC